MADIVIDEDTVTVRLTAAEKVEALHGDVTVNRAAVTAVRAVPDCMAEVHGFRAPGAGFPGVIMVGTWRYPGGTTLAVCHGQKPAVVLDLASAKFSRLVVTVDNPDDIVSALA